MNSTVLNRRAARVFELIHPRLGQLGLCSWLCDDAGEILRRESIAGDDGALIAGIEPSIQGIAGAAWDEPRRNLIGRENGRIAIPLTFGPRGCGAGVIIAVSAARVDQAAAGQLAAVARWTFADLCKSVKDDETLDQFGEKLAQAYEETNLLFRLAPMLNGMSDPDSIIQDICGQMREILPFGWVAMKFSADAAGVAELQGRLLSAGDLPGDAARFAAAADGLVTLSRSRGWTRLLPAGHCELSRIANGEVIAEPITHDDQVIGAVLAGGKQGDDSDFTDGEMQFLHAAANLLAIFHENLSRFAEQRAMFMGTLKALTASIDAKDAYTRGHSERVARLSRKLATVMGRPEQEIETFYVSGLVHDIGKIGVPEAVLCKRGKLDECELALIRRHPEIGHGILKDIPAMAGILPGVRHHHERWDGLGYPDGLAGEQIPLMARVIAVADTFDAMNSTRSYRPALPLERTVQEIRKYSGTQFDPQVVEAFLRIDLDQIELAAKAAA